MPPQPDPAPSPRRSVTAVHLTVIHQPYDVRIFHKECTTLSAAGYDVHLLAHDAADGAVDGVHMHPIPPPTWRIRGLRGVQRLYRAFKTAASLKPTICHFHDPELIPVGIALKMRRVQVLYDVHEDKPREILTLAGTSRGARVLAHVRSVVFAGLEAAAARIFDGFIVAIPSIRTRFPSSRTVLVRNVPRLEEFDRNRGPSADRPRERPNVVVYAGGLSRVRGLREMVSAVQLLPPKLDARLLLLGSPTGEEARLELARLKGTQGVEFGGWQSREALAQDLARAKIGLLLFHPAPDHVLALPNKLFEYMAAGLPIVASDFPLWREIIEAERCGVLVDPLDPRSIADGIRLLLESPDEAHAMGQRGRAAVEQRYNWATESAGLLSLYRSVSEPLPTNGA